MDELTVIMLVALGIMVLIAVQVGLFLALEAVIRARRQRGVRVLRYLEMAVRLSVPIPEFLLAAAASEGRGLARRMGDLSGWLAGGSTINDALRCTLPEVSARHREILGAAERTGNLGPVLTDLVRRELDRGPTITRSEWMSLIYPLGLSYVMASVAVFFLVFVAPKFREIFADFDRDLPPITQSLMKFSGANAEIYHHLFIGLMILAFFALMAWAIFRICVTPGPRPISTLRDTFSELQSRIPFFGRAFFHMQLADVCYVAAVGIRASLPSHSALLETQTLTISPSLRRRVVRWAQTLKDGATLADGAKVAGMPRLLVGMLASGEATGEAADTLDFLARYYRHRFSRSLELLRGALVPVAVMCCGVMVLWLVIALLLPACKLIDSVMTP